MRGDGLVHGGGLVSGDGWRPTARTGDPGACTERELTGPVDECLPDGRLNPAAVGWSRRPLLRSNLRGWGRNKRWDYWCVTTDTHLFSVTYSDVDYLAILNAWVLDFATKRVWTRDAAVPLGVGVSLPDTVDGGPMTFDGRGLSLAIEPEPDGTRLRAAFRSGGVPVEAEVFVALPDGHETLSVVIPWSETRFQYTSKHNTRPATGVVTVGDETFAFGPHNHAFGCLDYGRGVWPYRTRWNWGSASGPSDGRVVGLQLGGKWTDGTGATENALCIDGRLHKLSEDLVWEYSPHDWLRPWRITTPLSSRVDLCFEPFHERASKLDLGVLGTEVHQCFGHYSGTVVTDDGTLVAVDRVLGWAEEARMRW